MGSCITGIFVIAGITLLLLVVPGVFIFLQQFGLIALVAVPMLLILVFWGNVLVSWVSDLIRGRY